MLIAISGSQGSGKSTLLNELHKLGYPIISRKTSRSILSDWNVTLQDVNNSPELTVRFQQEILIRKYEDEREAIESDKLWFGERTYTDLFVYCLIALGKDNEHSGFVDSYYEQCKTLNAHYNHTFYLTAGHFDVEHDGVRGSNTHYSKMVDLIMMDSTLKMIENVSVINIQPLKKRVEFIQFFI